MMVALKKVVSVFAILGEAKVANLESAEILKVVKARKGMRAMVDAYKAYEEDVYKSYRVDGLEDADKVRMEVIEKLKKDAAYQPTDEEMKAIGMVNDFFANTEKAKAEELSREVDVQGCGLTEDSIAVLLKDNGWSPKVLDEIEELL